MLGLVRTPARSVQAIAAVFAALALCLGASGCGVLPGGVDEGAVSKRLQEETEIAKLPADKRKPYADCLAKVVLKYGNKDDLKAYVDGKKQADDIRGMDGDAADDAAEKCAEGLR